VSWCRAVEAPQVQRCYWEDSRAKACTYYFAGMNRSQKDLQDMRPMLAELLIIVVASYVVFVDSLGLAVYALPIFDCYPNMPCWQ
jgi:hypothetical protein